MNSFLIYSILQSNSITAVSVGILGIPPDFWVDRLAATTEKRMMDNSSDSVSLSGADSDFKIRLKAAPAHISPAPVVSIAVTSGQGEKTPFLIFAI